MVQLDSTNPHPCADPSVTLGSILPCAASQRAYSEQDWAELIHAVAAGDQFALQALYDRSHHLVYTLAVRLTHSRETAEELTLEVYGDIWQRAASYDPANGTVLGWIMSQTRSRALDRMHSEQHGTRIALQDDVSAAAADAPRSEDGLWAALEALTHEERQTIEAVYFSEMTCADAAGKPRQTIDAMRDRIRSALQKLRKTLAEKGAAR